MKKQSLILLAVAIAIVVLVVVGVVSYAGWYNNTDHMQLMNQQQQDEYSKTLSTYLRNTGNIARSEYITVTGISKELGGNTLVRFEVFDSSHQMMAVGTLELLEDSLSDIMNITVSYLR